MAAVGAVFILFWQNIISVEKEYRNREYSQKNRGDVMKTILITGGAGFIGSNLCHHLIADHQVICMDNLSCGSLSHISDLMNHSNFTFILHDVKEPFDIPCDQIYHLAAHASPKYYMENPVETAMTIGLGTVSALNNARKHKATILLASTSEIYGEPDVHPQPESYYGNVNTVGPRSCYDQSKRWMETLGNDHRRSYGTDVKIVRIFNTYGPRMKADDGRIISELLVHGIKGEQVFIYGDGHQTRSFCYIDDMIEQLTGVINSDCTEPVNCGNDQEFSINQIAEKISGWFEQPLQLNFVSALINDPIRRRPQLNRLHSLGLNAHTDIEDGLKRTLDYFMTSLKQGEL